MKSRKTGVLLCCIAVVAAAFVYMVSTGLVVFDHSAELGFENSIIWKGVKYGPVSGRYSEGKTIAKVKDSGLSINEAEEDDSHTFLVVRSFIDQWLVVREDYDIPSSGKITKLWWNFNFIEDSEFIAVVEALLERAEPEFVYDNSNGDIGQYKGDDVMRELIVAYEGCPVPTKNLGYMGKTDGRWCITVGEVGIDKADCYYIPEEYIPVLEQYWT